MNTRYNLKTGAQFKNDIEDFALELQKEKSLHTQSTILIFISKLIKRFNRFINNSSVNKLRLKKSGGILNGKIVSLLNHLRIHKTFKVENIVDEKIIVLNYSSHLGLLFVTHLN